MSAGGLSEQVRSLLGSAIRAPSSHNTQPWRFRIGESQIDLFADRTRALPVNDPEDRELTISCGAALMNLRLAAADHGFSAQVRRLPDAAKPDWLARVSLRRDSGEPGTKSRLADFMKSRRTYRKRFADREVDSAIVEALVDAAASEGAWLRPFHAEEARQQAAALVAEGDAAQWADPAWRRELAAWMRPRRHGDGLSVPALAAPIARLVVRNFDMGKSLGARDRELAEASPLLVVLGTEHDDPQDWLRAGEALQRVLLAGCQRKLQASYLNQPIQVASLRPRLQELVGGEFPQVLLRFGFPEDEIPAEPRRPLEAVIEEA